MGAAGVIAPHRARLPAAAALTTLSALTSLARDPRHVLLRALRRNPRSQGQSEVGLLVNRRRSRGFEQCDLGLRGKRGQFRSEHIAATRGNGHRVVAIDVGNGGVALAGEGIGGDDAHPGQRDVAGFYRAVHQAAGDRGRCGVDWGAALEGGFTAGAAAGGDCAPAGVMREPLNRQKSREMRRIKMNFRLLPTQLRPSSFQHVVRDHFVQISFFSIAVS